MTITAFKVGVGQHNIFADESVESLGLKGRPGCEEGPGAGSGNRLGRPRIVEDTCYVT